MFEITCKRSGLMFLAESKRIKQHPNVSSWLQKANKEGWYGFCVEAIEKGVTSKLETIEKFESLIQEARVKGLKIKHETNEILNQREEQLKLAKKRDSYISKILRENGYKWHSFDVLDIAQGETGEKNRLLFKVDDELTVNDALAKIAANNSSIKRGLDNFGIKL